MKRAVMLALLGSVTGIAILLGWHAVRQDREYGRLLTAGNTALAADQTFEAIEAFSGALAIRPDSMLAHLKRGDTYRRRGELVAALRDLREAAVLNPGATEPQELLGDVNATMNRPDRAAEHYRAFVALDDRSPRVLHKLAVVYYRLRQPARAIEVLRQALAIDEASADAHYLLGLGLRDLRRGTEAADSLERAVALDPALTAARRELAALLLAAGRSREAIAQLELIAATEPSRVEALVAVGLAQARLGPTDTALRTLGRAAEHFPDAALVHAALGRVWLNASEQHGDPIALRKALEALRVAAASPTPTSEALTGYGRALYLAGDMDAAERVLAHAVTRFPVDATAFLYLADTNEHLGRFTEARDALVDYVSLVGDDVAGTHAARIRRLAARLSPRGAQRVSAPQGAASASR